MQILHICMQKSMRMFADVFNEPVEVLLGKELGVQEAAFNAGIAAGIYSDFENAAAQCVQIDQSYGLILREQAYTKD